MTPKQRKIQPKAAREILASSKPNPESSRESRVYSTFKCPALLGVIIMIFVAGYLALQKQEIQNRNVLADDYFEARDATIFSVQEITGKGKGVIALRDIKRGELVIRERPLFIVPSEIITSPTALISHHLSLLTPYQHDQFFNLSYVNFPPYLDPETDLAEVALAIFQTNAVSAGGAYVGVFPRMARLNHGCSSAFNVVYTWREKEGVLVVHALKDIRKGQELLTTYTDTKRPRDQRRAHLHHQYAFHCTCDVCSLPDKHSKESDHRLVSMSELYVQFATWGTSAIDGSQAIEIVKRIWELGSEEGYWSERGRLAADAAWVSAAHSDAASTMAWANVAEEWFGYEVGLDSEQVQEMRLLQTQPKEHPAWASRWAMHVPAPTV